MVPTALKQEDTSDITIGRGKGLRSLIAQTKQTLMKIELVYGATYCMNSFGNNES